MRRIKSPRVSGSHFRDHWRDIPGSKNLKMYRMYGDHMPYVLQEPSIVFNDVKSIGRVSVPTLWWKTYEISSLLSLRLYILVVYIFLFYSFLMFCLTAPSCLGERFWPKQSNLLLGTYLTSLQRWRWMSYDIAQVATRPILGLRWTPRPISGLRWTPGPGVTQPHGPLYLLRAKP